MSEKINLDITRDKTGIPITVVAAKNGDKIRVEFTPNGSLKLYGSRRSLKDQELFQALKLIYPSQEKQISIFQDAEMVQADVYVAGLAVTVLYTVPAGKKLYILSAFCTTTISAAGGAGPWGGTIYLWEPKTSTSITFSESYWDTAVIAGTIITDNIGFINYGFPSGLQFRHNVFADCFGTAGFVGLLVDA